MTRRVSALTASVVACALAGCAPHVVDGPPAAGPAAVPNVTCDGAAFLVSWIEGPPDAARLRLARHDGHAFDAPVTVAHDRPLLVNWADFPSFLALADGRLVAQWLERSPAASFAYGVRIAISADDGATWSAPTRPHADESAAEFGFVSLVESDRGLHALWLDGREVEPAGQGRMSLRECTLRDGGWGEERVLDADACTCCQTSAAAVPDGIVVAYRAHAGPLRDIAVLALDDAGSAERRPFPADGWAVGGCPVNGPAIDAHGRQVAVAWYTEAAGTPRVLLALSSDGGRSFAAPLVVDDGAALGRVDLALLPDDGIVVSWLEGPGPGEAAVRARLYTPDGARRQDWTVGRTLGARTAGFPRLAACGDRIGVAWTVPGPPSTVRFSVLTPGAR